MCFKIKNIYTALSTNTDVTKKPTVLSQQVAGPVYDLGRKVIVHSERKKRKDTQDKTDFVPNSRSGIWAMKQKDT